MLSEITNTESLGYAFVVCGLFVSVAFYIASIAYGVYRLEKSVEALEATVNRPAKTRRSTKTKTTKGTKNVNKKR